MAHATSQGMWLQVPALDVSEIQATNDCLSCYNSCLEHYRTCRRAHAGARLLGTISFYHMKRFQLYAGQGQHSSYDDWAQSFKNHPDNPELRTADMEWLARAGGIMSYVMKLEGLPDQGRRADYIIQEVGSLTQLKAVFPKVFNKGITWDAGARLHDVDLLVYEFRRIRDALKAPGMLQQLYRQKWPSKAKKAASVTGSVTAEPMFPPAMQEEPAAAVQGASAAGAAEMGTHLAAGRSSEGSALEGSPGATSVLAAPAAAVSAPATARMATATTALATHMPASPGHGVDGSNVISGAAAAAAAAAAAGAASPTAVGRTISNAAVNSDFALKLTTAAAAGGGGRAAAQVAMAAEDGTVASFAAGEAAEHLQTALSGSGDNLHNQDGQLHQLFAPQHDLRPKLSIKLPALGIVSRNPPAAVDVPAPEPDSPAQPSSPFQQFLHVLIDDNIDSADLPQQQPQQQQQQQQEQQQQQQQQEQSEEGNMEDEHVSMQQEQVWEQALQLQQSSGGDAGTEEGREVSEEWQPPAATAASSGSGRNRKRKCPEVTAATKPGPSKRSKNQQVGGAEHDGKAGRKEGEEGSGKVLQEGSLDGGCTDTTPSSNDVPITPGQQQEQELPVAEPNATETSNGDDSDSSMTDDSTIADGITAQQQHEQQQLLLRNLQQKRVMGGTLLQWMQQNAAKIGLRITAEQAQQEGGLLNQVFVVTKWSDDLKPLVRVKNNRGFMVIVDPDQQAAGAHECITTLMPAVAAAAAVAAAPALGLVRAFMIIVVPDQQAQDQQAQDAPPTNQMDAPSEWKGTPAEWRVPKEMLTACKVLQQRSGAEGDRIVASHAGANLHLRRNDLACLRAPAWLSDECVNFYMALLQDRDSVMCDNRHLFREGTGAYRTYYFNTHFTSKLKLGNDDYSYKDVQRWTSLKHRTTGTSGEDCDMLQQKVLKYDRLVIPIHQQTPYQHWTVLLVDLTQQRLVFFDSYKTDNPIGPIAMQRVKTWLKDEAKDKLGEDWTTFNWAEEFPPILPRQENDYDCGVFALMTCNRLGLKGGAFDFDQGSMDNIRAAIAHDLKAAKLIASANPGAA